MDESSVCEYCDMAPAKRGWSEEQGEFIYLCGDCRADEAYAARRGKERAEP